MEQESSIFAANGMTIDRNNRTAQFVWVENEVVNKIIEFGGLEIFKEYGVPMFPQKPGEKIRPYTDILVTMNANTSYSLN